jgi:IS30 family transposase
MDRGPQAMARHVEERIKTLHEKLGITSEQEEMWGDVAQTMRDNEATIATLVETRHKNAKDMNAIDDLKSYEEITQAHADGIKKLIVSFETLYAEMSDPQKKVADDAFGLFEGRRGNKAAKKLK